MAAYYIKAFLLSIFASFVVSQSFNFTNNGFSPTDLVLKGAANIILPSGALRLTDRRRHISGQGFHPNPINFFNNSSPNASSFSTSFVFAIVRSSADRGGHGLAFTLSPATEFPGGQAGHYLGILNPSNDESPTNHLFAVEFDTVRGIRDPADAFGNHVGININSMSSSRSRPATYYNSGTKEEVEVDLESGEPLRAWIDYDGANKIVNVTLSPSLELKPTQPLISETLDLSLVINDHMYVGFSAATGNKTSSHYILGWSFRLNGKSDPIDLSRLPPVPPREKNSSSLTPQIKALIAVLSVAMFLLVILFFCVVMYRRRMRFSALEDWEVDHPHRFRYKDLYVATKGFSKSQILGVGGFSEVYKGVLPTTGSLVAVKKIMANNPLQGMKEFVAEVESLGRLRHKNLVNLQGWCKKKNDFLLVYEYIPNGTLHSLLFKPKNGFMLNWEQRFNIIKGIAAGLLYLHEEWEKVVIHRDVKSSNVLIDSELNAKLGDFGLARLYDHGKNSHTTNLVGTVGYIAPELTRIGKASTSSDVFAYGVLLLEVVSGKKPIVNDPICGYVTLVDWVFDCIRTGQILEAVDPKLNSAYAVEEMELVLGLGILCCQGRPEARPSMRQIMRCLNGDELLPVLDKLGSFSSRPADERTSRLLEMIVNGIITASDGSSSIRDAFTSSFETEINGQNFRGSSGNN